MAEAAMSTRERRHITYALLCSSWLLSENLFLWRWCASRIALACIHGDEIEHWGMLIIESQ